MTRVMHAPGARVTDGAAEHPVVPPSGASPLAASLLRMAPSATTIVATGEDHVVLYALEGSATLAGDDLGPGTAAFLPDGERSPLLAGPGGFLAIRLGSGPGCDRHAPLGERARIARVDLGRADRATGDRTFQVLFDMHNGCDRATVFVGVVPPGRAPWHFHQYDEIVWILEGHGLYHLAGGVEEFQAGAAFRVRPREVHIVENSATTDLVLLGMFTPAGSPLSAYVAGDPRDG